MHRKALCVLIMVFAAAVVLSGGCTGRDQPGELSFSGTVRYVPFEGGFYGIVSENGKKYDPLDLAGEYRQDGLDVSVRGKVKKDIMSFHMWGRPLEIYNIEKKTASQGGSSVRGTE